MVEKAQVVGSPGSRNRLDALLKDWKRNPRLYSGGFGFAYIQVVSELRFERTIFRRMGE